MQPDRRTTPLNPSTSRRTLLAGGLAAGAGAVLLGGCSGPSAPVDLPRAARTGPARSGGTLRVARPPASDAETLDPASSLSAYEYLAALYDRLVQVGADGELEGALAESWEVSGDAMTWTFRMRTGVTWHDGKPFTAADAATALEHLLDPDVASPQAAVLTPLVDPAELSTPDEHTLVVPLLAPNADFPSLLTNYNCHVVRPDVVGTGTGPFRLESFTPAGRGSVTAYADHWRGRPTLDRVEFSSVADVGARTNALLAGQVDLVSQTNLDVATARVVAASDRTTIARVPNAQWYVLPMLTTVAPFTDNRVRQAFKLAYDPQAVLDLTVQGNGTVGNDNPLPPEDPYWTDYRVERDPEQARFLLRQAGVEDIALDVSTSSYDPILTPMAIAYRTSAAEAGIRLSVSTESADSYYTSIWMQVPLMATYWYTGRSADQLFNQIFRGGSSYNETAWSDPVFDDLLDSARASVDETRRRTLYQDAQRYVVDNGGAMTPMFADRLVGISRDVVNYHEVGFEFDWVSIGFAAEDSDGAGSAAAAVPAEEER